MYIYIEYNTCTNCICTHKDRDRERERRDKEREIEKEGWRGRLNKNIKDITARHMYISSSSSAPYSNIPLMKTTTPLAEVKLSVEIRPLRPSHQPREPIQTLLSVGSRKKECSTKYPIQSVDSKWVCQYTDKPGGLYILSAHNLWLL